MRSTTCYQHTVYFRSLITGLLERCRAKAKKKDKLLNAYKPHTGELELKVWESRGGKKNHCARAQEKIKESKDAKKAGKGTPKKMVDPCPLLWFLLFQQLM